MGISFSLAELKALRSDGQSIGIFFRINTDPVVRAWVGIGDCDVGADAFGASGATYSGLGQITNVPPVEQLINGIAARVDFSMSGVSSDVVAMAAAEAAIVNGKKAALGFSVFGKDWQQLSPAVYWLWRGIGDYVVVAGSTQSAGAGSVPQQVRSITLSVGTLFSIRRNRGRSYLTDDDQQSRSPGDAFCERTVLYNNYGKVWPKLIV